MRDIQMKGATLNFNTKPNEKEHRPLKAYYQFHTNYKNFGKQVRKSCLHRKKSKLRNLPLLLQILSMNETDVASAAIRNLIDRSKPSQLLPTRNAAGITEPIEGADCVPLITPNGGRPHLIGSFATPRPVNLSVFAAERSIDDDAFRMFSRRVSREVANQLSKAKFFSNGSAQNRFSLPADTKVCLIPRPFPGSYF